MKFKNEGFVKCFFFFCSFPRQKIKPVDSEYREGRELMLTNFIKQGSYGEVYGAQDVNTGFRFAVKKVTVVLRSWDGHTKHNRCCSKKTAAITLSDSYLPLLLEDSVSLETIAANLNPANLNLRSSAV